METLILYSKPGCHLCEGLQEKLEMLPVQLEIRDITQNEAWFQRYQYEVPVLCHPIQASAEVTEGSTADSTVRTLEKPLPRLSPRASVKQVAKMIQTHIGPFES